MAADHCNNTRRGRGPGAQLLSTFLRKKGDPDLWIHLGLFAVLGIVFWPITSWLGSNAFDQSRLLHAFVALALAIVALLRFSPVEVGEVLSLNSSSIRALLMSFALLLAYAAGRHLLPGPWQQAISLLVIPAYGCALAALFRFLFGESTRLITRTAATVLCAFLFLSMLMAPLDWPLRGFAGQCSAAALSILGKSVDLGFLTAAEAPPKLILLVNDYPFHVASECNGFGVILASLLIALLLVIYRRVGPLGIGIGLVSGLAVGFTMNIVRIVIIVLLAPSLMDHYHLMHEVVGTLTYWGSLLLVWVLLRGPTDNQETDGQPQTSA